MPIRQILRASMALALVAHLAAQSRPAQPHRRAADPKTASPLPDAELEKQIRDRLAKSAIGGEKFTVRVQGGVATIEGRTEQLSHKGIATRLAKAAGAVGVSNRVEASDEARRNAAANLQQGRRRGQVKRGEVRSGSAGPRTARVTATTLGTRKKRGEAKKKN